MVQFCFELTVTMGETPGTPGLSLRRGSCAQAGLWPEGQLAVWRERAAYGAMGVVWCYFCSERGKGREGKG
jgi:hypothetical protein